MKAVEFGQEFICDITKFSKLDVTVSALSMIPEGIF